MDDQRPDWLREPCSTWCDGDHRGQQPPDDRRHFSTYSILPVIRLTTTAAPNGRHVQAAEAGELTILATQWVGDNEVWVVVADDEQALEITVESTRRLLPALAHLLNQIDDTTGRSTLALPMSALEPMPVNAAQRLSAAVARGGAGSA